MILRRLSTAAAALIMAAAVFPFGPVQAGDKDMQRTVTVSASASISAKPDMARITSGVQTEAASAKEAASANTKTMANLIDGLKSLGIEEKDIQTSNFSVNPRYQHSGDGRPPRIDGYQVSNDVNVVIRDLKAVGDILDKMIGLGANQVRGLAFEVSAAETLTDEARTAAIANARRRAELFAKAAGAGVGEVIEIREGGGGYEGPRPMRAARSEMAMSVPIEAGEQSLAASVTVTWELK
ncbi:MAG: SIMPL domain-containing protein [Alphaproteobacteria bacterium]|nr:SIMPL domain-containing protein [Alphaproteobacteria bacterium]